MGSMGTFKAPSLKGTITVVSDSVLSFQRSLQGLLLGFGFEKCIFGGITRCSSANTALMRPVSPDAPSPCPTLDFACRKFISLGPFSLLAPTLVVTYGSDVYAFAAKSSRYGCSFHNITDFRPSPVALDKCCL